MKTHPASRAFLSLAQFWHSQEKTLYKLCNKFFDEHVLLFAGMHFQPQVYYMCAWHSGLSYDYYH